MEQTTTDLKPGAQRLSIEQLEAWEKLKLGMFIHFGMSTFVGAEKPSGNEASTLYAPDRLDVDQWIRAAKACGMKYAVLTAKHVAGHCLWPSDQTDYHVGTSGNPTDVVAEFVAACRKHGLMPGLYYCSWDNHHRFGSKTRSDVAEWERKNPEDRMAFVTRAYMDFQMAQIEELLTRYGPIGEVWIDIPSLLPRFFRQELYDRIADLQPSAVVMMNNGIGDGTRYMVGRAWPSDLIAIERFLPNSLTGHIKWREIEGERYYVPGEVCDPIGGEWFFTEEDQPRSDQELLGMALVANSRGANLLLDVGPDKHGLIPGRFLDALERLGENLRKNGALP